MFANKRILDIAYKYKLTLTFLKSKVSWVREDTLKYEEDCVTVPSDQSVRC